MDGSLEFEKPLNELSKKIGMLQQKKHLKPDEREQLHQLMESLQCRTKEIYAKLTPWQIVQVARHQDRPCAADYIRLMCEDFLELHGDRAFRDDPAILAGPAKLADMTVMFICQQKGHSIKEKRHHNFGMPHPEGYRKSYRLMQQAEKFGFPLICLIDTPGAFPGLEDEERGQSQAIASNLYLMSHLRVPIISVVIGEGGSGGALAIGIADPHGSALYGWYANGELKAEGNSISEGIGQGRVTANLEGLKIDHAYRISDTEMLLAIYDLVEHEGLVMGGSTGINVAGAIRMAKDLGPGKTIVTVLADYGQRYQSKLFNPDFLRERGLPTPAWME